jgi:hypothetical protein
MLSVLRPISNPEDQVPVLMSPTDRVAQLYPKASGSLFVAFYDTQGDGRGILNTFHTGNTYKYWTFLLSGFRYINRCSVNKLSFRLQIYRHLRE